MNKNPNHPDRPHPITQRQGDSTTVAVKISEPLPEDMDVKIGFYSPYGKPLFEATLSGGGITRIDDTHLLVELPHEMTRRMAGATTLRAVIYAPDLSYVNAGENAVPVVWEGEPATRNLK